MSSVDANADFAAGRVGRGNVAELQDFRPTGPCDDDGAHLTGDLRGRLHDLGVPPSFQSIVINAIKQGSVPGGTTKNTATSTYGGIVAQVYDAAYAAFRSGLVTCLVLEGRFLV